MAKRKKLYPENKAFLDKIISKTGITLAELARRLGESKQTVYGLYHGKLRINVLHLQRLKPFSAMNKEQYSKHISESFEL